MLLTPHAASGSDAQARASSNRPYARRRRKRAARPPKRIGFDESKAIGVAFFEAGRRRAEIFELVEEALDDGAEAIEQGLNEGSAENVGWGARSPTQDAESRNPLILLRVTRAGYRTLLQLGRMLAKRD